MIEYNTLKLESKNDYNVNDTSTQALSSLLSTYYNTDSLVSIKFIKAHIENTTNPVEFLRKVEKGIN